MHTAAATRAEFQQRLRECLLAFSRSAAGPRHASAALGAMAAEAAALMGAPRASIWLHDRRARELWLAALVRRLGGRRAASGYRPASPASLRAMGLTLDRPTRLGDDVTSPIVAPLRGWRRALGTLVIEGDVRRARPPTRHWSWRTTSRASCRWSSRTSCWSRRWSASTGCSRTRSTRSRTC